MADHLLVKSIELCSLQTAQKHHTERFECVHDDEPTPVLRRGQPFPVAITFSNRPYDQGRDVIMLTFSFGEKPSVGKGSRAVLAVGPKGARCLSGPGSRLAALEWDVALHAGHDATAEPLLKLQVEAAADCPVGKWKLEVKTRLRGDTTGQAGYFSHPQDIYILFNPWSKKDQVYMENERYLDEYVLNDVGKIWIGPWGSSRGREWVFGQFDSCVLPSALQALRWSPLKDSQRGDPVRVARAISKMVNSNDDRGILEGRWDGDYEDGTAPAAWTGSVPIMQQYLDTGAEVKYGQCWVFAGVAATVCRALGMPARVVSNLVSAHDANESLTVDRYYDAENNEMDEDPNNPNFDMDSVWNYHVWTDVWMARPDLPRGYGGWQAIDPTPQELSTDADDSSGSYQCGPASLEAIRCGAVGFNYDVGFMLASVNADVFRWKEDPDCELGYKSIHCDKYHIGRMILTKAPWIFDPNGDKDRQEITDQYKYKEGTKSERLALMNAVRSVDRARRFYMLPTQSHQDVEFSLVDLDKVAIGKDFSITINIHNHASVQRRVRAVLTASSVYYTGVKANLIKKDAGDFTIQPSAKESLRLKVTVDEYLDKLVEYCQLKIAAIATVLDTNETWADEDDFELTRPPLVMKVEDDSLTVGRAAVISFSLKNPLKKRLTGCRLRYESPGLVKATVVDYRDVEPEEEVTFQQRFTPAKAGEHKLVGTFSSKELVDITGALAFDVFD
uniref:Hemocyte protein-glutamine gamma-glutamyltransferase n=1 Tax=Schistocerca gregaria TaxID=7010 RepID=A0A8E5NI81_SCHGR|nr:Hemocyte protein-glutamine gamma-glutamyltransferase [Schistocerca gregaria]